MRVTADIATFGRLLRQIDPDLRPLQAWDLAGGVSALVTAVMAAQSDGSLQTLVVRQYSAANLNSDPLIASHEFALLDLLHARGLPVPRPRYADESRTILPVPCLVIEFIDGQAVTEPSQVTQPMADVTSQLAAVLARLHAAAFTLAEVPFLADIAGLAARKIDTWPTTVDESLREATVRTELARIWPPPRFNQPVLLHGDFWPGNTLWHDGTLVGIVDWEDAVLGDPLADVGNTRMEIGMLFGEAAASDFTHAYRALMADLDMTALPYWDLYASLRHAGRMVDWGLMPADLARLRAGHRHFTGAALAQVAGLPAQQ